MLTVYVVRLNYPGPDHIYKIGRTLTATEIRRKGLQTACPWPLSIEAEFIDDEFRGLESNLHRRFAEYRMQGEWFNFGDADGLQMIKTAVRGYDFSHRYGRESPRWTS